jgi:hypothetical protein
MLNENYFFLPNFEFLIKIRKNNFQGFNLKERNFGIFFSFLKIIIYLYEESGMIQKFYFFKSSLIYD